MAIPLTAEERTLRLRLDEAVHQLRSTLRHCPAVDEIRYLHGADIDLAADVAEELNHSLLDALSCTEALEKLQNASEEAVLLCATSRVALGVVREVLTVLAAALDAQRAA